MKLKLGPAFEYWDCSLLASVNHTCVGLSAFSVASYPGAGRGRKTFLHLAVPGYEAIPSDATMGLFGL